MRHFKYILVCGIIGLIGGLFFGLIFDSSYAKKSQFATKQTFQAILFGAIGTISGIVLGNKMANEEDELDRKKNDKIQKEREYQLSLIESNCESCGNLFKYSTFSPIEYSKHCNKCISDIRDEYQTKIKEIEKLLSGIELLKRHSSIISRLDKAEIIANSIINYESLNFPFMFQKPSNFIQRISEIRDFISLK